MCTISENYKILCTDIDISPGDALCFLGSPFKSHLALQRWLTGSLILTACEMLLQWDETVVVQQFHTFAIEEEKNRNYQFFKNVSLTIQIF